MDPSRLVLCRAALEEAAKSRTHVAYSSLAKIVGVANQGLRPYLQAIYESEMAARHPDLTLVAVYANTRYGRYNSRGGDAQSIRVDPQNAADVAAYEADLEQVYEFWSSPTVG